MNNKTITCLLLVMLSSSFLYAEYIDTGYKTFTQPNGVSFTGRYWGDEFSDWTETQDGYRIVRNWSGGWYYYAILDASGEFAASDRKVAIDPPLASSYKLERSESRKEEIQATIDAFNTELDSAYQRYLNTRGTIDTTYRLGVILVDFTPSELWQNDNNPNGYNKAYFDSLIFSRNYWYYPEGTNQIHPDSHALFGSFSDYYWDQSLGTVQFEGKDGILQIVNPIDPDDPFEVLPKWVVLPEPKCYYAGDHSCYAGYTSLSGYFNAATDSAISQLGIDISQFNFLAFISAGPRYHPNLRGIAQPSQGRYNFVEVSHYLEPFFFSHIGPHAHEFAHLIGIYHHYGASMYWNLMGYSANGPSYEGACPSGFCPYDRAIKLGWVTMDTIQSDVTITITYDYQNPMYYWIASPTSSYDYIIENRLRAGFDLWTPNPPSYETTDPPSIDPNGNLGGLLIWRDGRDLVVADNEPFSDTNPPPNTDEKYKNLARDPFPFDQQDGSGSGLNLNDITTPSTNNIYGSYSYLAFNNITWNPTDSSSMLYILFNYDPPPETPTGFYITGSIHENPTLHWNANSEPDMAGYMIYRKSEYEQEFSLIATINNPQTTSYTDTEVYIAPKGQGPIVLYHMTAFDLTGLESDPTINRWVWELPYRQVVLADQIPETFALHENYPNPFNPVTTIKYDLPEESFVELIIFDLIGREVKTVINGIESAGFKCIVWDGKDNDGNKVPSGMYVYRFRAKSLESDKQFYKTMKMVLLR